MRGYRRRNYLVDIRYQGKFVIGVILIGAFGLVLALTAFNLLAYRKIESVIWMIHIDANSIGELIRPYLIYTNIFGFAVAAISLIIFSRRVLHKTAPPLFRLKRYIERAGKFNLVAGLDWVARDEFQETAKELNGMVRTLRDKFRAVKERAGDVVAVSGVMGYIVDRPELAAEKCDDLLGHLKALKDSLERVKES